jgi:membrane protein required for colicin V production
MFLSSYIRVIDIVLAALLVWGTYKGYKKGFVMEFIAFFVFLVVTVLCFVGFGKLFIITDEKVGEVPKLIVFSIYLFLYLAGLVGLDWLGKFLEKKNVKYPLLDNLENAAGGVLGFIKYCTAIAVLVGLFEAAGVGMPPDVKQDSFLYPRVLQYKSWLLRIGETLAPSIGSSAKGVEKILDRKPTQGK